MSVVLKARAAPGDVVELSVGYDDTVVLLRKQTPETGWGLQRTFNMHIDEARDRGARVP